MFWQGQWLYCDGETWLGHTAVCSGQYLPKVAQGRTGEPTRSPWVSKGHWCMWGTKASLPATIHVHAGPPLQEIASELDHGAAKHKQVLMKQIVQIVQIVDQGKRCTRMHYRKKARPRRDCKALSIVVLGILGSCVHVSLTGTTYLNITLHHSSIS